MSEALRAALPLAVAVAVFPVPVIASVLLVGADRGRAKALAFAVAFAAGLAGVGAVALVAGDLVTGGGDGAGPGVLLLVVGAVSLAAAARQWQRRPRAGEEPEMPRWMQAVDGMSAARAAATGLALSALNPKNVLLVASAATEIVAADVARGSEAAALAVFVLVASLGVLTPLVLAVALGERSGPLLDAIRRWMTRRSALLMAALLGLIGVKLVADGVAALTG